MLLHLHFRMEDGERLALHIRYLLCCNLCLCLTFVSLKWMCYIIYLSKMSKFQIEIDIQLIFWLKMWLVKIMVQIRAASFLSVCLQCVIGCWHRTAAGSWAQLEEKKERGRGPWLASPAWAPRAQSSIVNRIHLSAWLIFPIKTAQQETQQGRMGGGGC